MTLESVLREGLRESLKDRFKERRGKLEIMADILRVTSSGARKTEIVYKANLNFTRVETYIPYLEERDLLEISGPLYRTTPKGKEFLQTYHQMSNLLIN
jgi:predicted transcriptional regulator